MLPDTDSIADRVRARPRHAPRQLRTFARNNSKKRPRSPSPCPVAAPPPEPKEEDVPPEFCCPISLLHMVNPVVAMDGFTYERSQILRWLHTHGTSPCTRQHMLTVLSPNVQLRDRIAAWVHGCNVHPSILQDYEMRCRAEYSTSSEVFDVHVDTDVEEEEEEEEVLVVVPVWFRVGVLQQLLHRIPGDGSGSAQNPIILE